MASEYDSFRARLKSEQKTLTVELEQVMVSSSMSGERREGNHEEEATASLELERRLALEKQILGQLAEVEDALGKLDEDSYGRCENCGNPIGLARLEALPQAKLCLKCKSLQRGNARGRPPAS